MIKKKLSVDDIANTAIALLVMSIFIELINEQTGISKSEVKKEFVGISQQLMAKVMRLV